MCVCVCVYGIINFTSRVLVLNSGVLAGFPLNMAHAHWDWPRIKWDYIISKTSLESNNCSWEVFDSTDSLHALGISSERPVLQLTKYLGVIVGP